MFRAILIACLLAASSASAFVVDRDRHGGGATYTLCSAETTSDAVCDDGTNDRAAVVLGLTELTFDSTESTATSYTCDIYAAREERIGYQKIPFLRVRHRPKPKDCHLFLFFHDCKYI